LKKNKKAVFFTWLKEEKGSLFFISRKREIEMKNVPPQVLM